MNALFVGNLRRASPRLVQSPFTRSWWLTYEAMAPKRKASALANVGQKNVNTEIPVPDVPSAAKRQRPSRKSSKLVTDPDENPQVIDAPGALRASPDHEDGADAAILEPTARKKTTNKADAVKAEKAAPKGRVKDADANAAKTEKSSEVATPPTKLKSGAEGLNDPEAEGDEEADEEEIKEALLRPPPVNSDYLPLPWKGRLGYVSSRTTDGPEVQY